MFQDSLACIRKFVESDHKIRVMWNDGDVVCWGVRDVGFAGYWGCGMLVMWDVGDGGYPGCERLEIWHVGDVGCWGYGMFRMWDVWDVGCSICGMFGM